MRTSNRASRVAFSATLALDTRAKELAAQGVDVVSMAVGQPDLPPPQVARDAAKLCIDENRVRYTPVAGTPSLRKAIADHLTATRGVTIPPNEVCVCHSAKHALSATLLCLVDPGDEVLMPLPAWNSYEEEIKLAEGVPVGVKPRPDCGPDFDALRAACTGRTRGIMVNSPNNPSGYVWSKEETDALVALAEERDLWILSDEIYRRLVYEGDPSPSPSATGDAGRRRTLIVDGASKAFAMTGFRMGYVAGDPDVITAVARMASQMTGSPNTVAQDAYEACLVSEPPETEAMVATFGERREVLLAGLADLGLAVPRPRGAFYALPNVEPFLDERGAPGFCEDLLEAQAVALVPGDVFGMPGYVRMSYATSIDRIQEALRRLGAFLESRRG